MRALAIETSGRIGSVALAQDENILVEEQFAHGLKNAAQIIPIIDRLCRDRGWTARDLEHLYVSAGPGSFTGLRIGITLAKTLAFATGAKIVAVPSVRVLAENAASFPPPVLPGKNASSPPPVLPGNHALSPPPVLRGRVRVGAEPADRGQSSHAGPPPLPSPGVPGEGEERRRSPAGSGEGEERRASREGAQGRHVVIVLDAKRDQIFTARFERSGEELIEREPAHLDSMAAVIQRSPRPLLLLGEGIPFHKQFIPADDPTITIAPEELWRARASAVAKLGQELTPRGEFADPFTLTPIYIRPPEAEEKYNQRGGEVAR